MPEFKKVKDLCEMLGVSRQAVQINIRKGKIKAKKFGNKYLIPNEEFERIKREGV